MNVEGSKKFTELEGEISRASLKEDNKFVNTKIYCKRKVKIADFSIAYAMKLLTNVRIKRKRRRKTT